MTHCSRAHPRLVQAPQPSMSSFRQVSPKWFLIHCPQESPLSARPLKGRCPTVSNNGSQMPSTFLRNFNLISAKHGLFGKIMRASKQVYVTYYVSTFCEFCFQNSSFIFTFRCPSSVVRCPRASHPFLSPLYDLLDHKTEYFLKVYDIHYPFTHHHSLVTQIQIHKYTNTQIQL